MAAYSLDLRKRIVDAIERGVGTRNEVAKLFGVHESFVYKLLRQQREHCRDAPQYLVSLMRKSLVAAQIQPDAAEETDWISDPVAAALEHFDLVVQSFDPTAV